MSEHVECSMGSWSSVNLGGPALSLQLLGLMAFETTVSSTVSRLHAILESHKGRHRGSPICETLHSNGSPDSLDRVRSSHRSSNQHGEKSVLRSVFRSPL